MPCNTVKFNGASAIICTRGRGRSCYYCFKVSKFQCDFPVGKYKSGKKKGEPKTCDRHLCSDHVEHGVTKGIDFCPEHYPIAKAAYERRMENERKNK